MADRLAAGQRRAGADDASRRPRVTRAKPRCSGPLGIDRRRRAWRAPPAARRRAPGRAPTPGCSRAATPSSRWRLHRLRPLQQQRARAGEATRTRSRSCDGDVPGQARAQPAGDDVEALGGQLDQVRRPAAAPGRRRRPGRGAPPPPGRRSGASARPESPTRAFSSASTGVAISAAAVGVGARRSETKSIRVVSVSWPDGADQRDGAGRRPRGPGPRR